MSDFIKKFLLEDARRLNPAGRYAGLAAFGKHPGWDDHVEDLGLETESLNFAKTLLYVNGIGGQIDSGAWEKSDPAQQLPDFRHLFVWQRSGQILVGRLWSSSDGKGRKRYPMVVCAHFTGVTLSWALKQALPALAELEQGCLQTSSADAVRALLNRKRAALREAIQSANGGGEYAPVAPDLLHNTLSSADAARREGFLRVLYQLKGQFGAFAVGAFNPRGSSSAIRPQQIRVPAISENPEQTLLFWTRFFLAYVDASVPLLLALPLDAGWVDVTAGEPASHEFYCLRASPKAVPLVSEVPYQLDDTFRAKAAAYLDAFQNGKTPLPNLESAPVSAVPAGPEVKGGWLKWLGVGLVIVLGAVGAMIYFRKGDTPSANSQTPEANIAPANPVQHSEVKAPQPPSTTATPAKPPVKSPADTKAEAARLADERKQAEAMATAAKLKAEAEKAARERAVEEAARLAKEKEVAAQKEQLEKERLAAEVAAAKRKLEEQADAAKAQAIAVPAGTPVDANPASSAPPIPATAGNEMTNSIGMVLVALPSGIWVGKYEVTQAEFQKVMGANPSKSRNDRQPVERVTWNEAVEFTRRLTNLERGQLPVGKTYTLPTEQQWKEFVGGQKFEDLPARGATGRAEPLLVGQSGPANKFGLFDVLGNVWEWCLDGATGDEKLLKGGAFNSANYDRTLLPDRQVSNCGFRCVLSNK